MLIFIIEPSNFRCRIDPLLDMSGSPIISYSGYLTKHDVLFTLSINKCNYNNMFKNFKHTWVWLHQTMLARLWPNKCVSCRIRRLILWVCNILQRGTYTLRVRATTLLWWVCLFFWHAICTPTLNFTHNCMTPVTYSYITASISNRRLLNSFIHIFKFIRFHCIYFDH